MGIIVGFFSFLFHCNIFYPVEDNGGPMIDYNFLRLRKDDSVNPINYT